ncbi:hypothetical protein [Morganella morganii]|uniref:hypothetical protein n=1 Tax=Morganella morganii TaxID=582 RepID=UPI00298E183F|nr:hypothetical protein [Morganella morganii]MDW7782281.1 hypothetical protein [Morganella morganii]MDW7792422.1 hypothetical protein [Morganella morganii]
MADYTVRVELRNADWDTYNKLHESMAASGYIRTVVGDDGRRFKLPDAEYVASKGGGLNQVRDEVVRIAKAHNSDPSVLVTECLGRAWLLPFDK